MGKPDPQQPDANDRYRVREMRLTEASRPPVGTNATSQWRPAFLSATTVLARQRATYLALLFVYQICGAPFTPAFSIVAFSSAEAANALAFSRL
jgi:hypothetical protein